MKPLIYIDLRIFCGFRGPVALKTTEKLVINTHFDFKLD
jgi:hypothetical protein